MSGLAAIAFKMPKNHGFCALRIELATLETNMPSAILKGISFQGAYFVLMLPPICRFDGATISALACAR
jgi:hypothetical protein